MERTKAVDRARGALHNAKTGIDARYPSTPGRWVGHPERLRTRSKQVPTIPADVEEHAVTAVRLVTTMKWPTSIKSAPGAGSPARAPCRRLWAGALGPCRVRRPHDRVRRAGHARGGHRLRRATCDFQSCRRRLPAGLGDRLASTRRRRGRTTTGASWRRHSAYSTRRRRPCPQAPCERHSPRGRSAWVGTLRDEGLPEIRAHPRPAAA
jgi:hypothetical protein